MRKYLLIILILMIPALITAASLDEMLSQAKAKYTGGSFKEAMDVLGLAATAYQKDVEAKKSIADVYTEIGIKEYDNRNFKNAYDCFRTAVKLAPTNQVASQYFWKMKKEFDINNLKNEGVQAAPAPAPAPSPQVAAVEKVEEKAPAPVTPAIAPPLPLAESPEMKEALEKLRKAEADLEALKNTAFITRSESAQLKAELEAQKRRAELELVAIKEAASTAKSDSTLLREELEAQRRRTEEEREAQRKLLEKQTIFNTNLIIITGGIVFLILVFLISMIMLTRARIRRQFERQKQSPYYSVSPFLAAAEGAPRLPLPAAPPESFLLDIYPAPGPEEGKEEAVEGEAMYRDLLRAGRLKKMYDQMKSGALKWDTVRDYIQELDKELRVEILKVVEAKLLENDLFSPQAVLPILFPFLTEHDDYLREKAEHLAKKALLPAAKDLITGKEEISETALLEGPEAAAREPEDSLSLKRCFDIAERLKIVLKGRDASPITAKLARGIGHLLGLSDEDEELLYRAALVHDVGYLMLDRSKLQRIIFKTAITEEDFKFIRSHTKKVLKLPEPIKDAIMYHHERNDGSGYPKGLKNHEIPLFAKIIGVAETYVALLSERPYREKLTPEGALAIIKDGISSKFDRDHVNALAEFVRRTTGGIR